MASKTWWISPVHGEMEVAGVDATHGDFFAGVEGDPDFPQDFGEAIFDWDWVAAAFRDWGSGRRVLSVGGTKKSIDQVRDKLVDLAIEHKAKGMEFYVQDDARLFETTLEEFNERGIHKLVQEDKMLHPARRRPPLPVRGVAVRQYRRRR